MSPLTLISKPHKRILVIDPSASHLAYAFVDIDNKTFKFEKVGMLWTLDKWSNGKKLLYMYNHFLSFMAPMFGVTAIYTEGYFVNFKQRMGSSMIPTVNNLIQMGLADVNLEEEIGYAEISPSTWRNILGIKAIKKENGSKDFKTPTKAKVEEVLKSKLPVTITSNINERERALPTDIADCMAIALSIGHELKCDNYQIDIDAFKLVT